MIFHSSKADLANLKEVDFDGFDTRLAVSDDIIPELFQWNLKKKKL